MHKYVCLVWIITLPFEATAKYHLFNPLYLENLARNIRFAATCKVIINNDLATGMAVSLPQIPPFVLTTGHMDTTGNLNGEVIFDGKSALKIKHYVPQVDDVHDFGIAIMEGRYKEIPTATLPLIKSSKNLASILASLQRKSLSLAGYGAKLEEVTLHGEFKTDETTIAKSGAVKQIHVNSQKLSSSLYNDTFKRMLRESSPPPLLLKQFESFEDQLRYMNFYSTVPFGAYKNQPLREGFSGAAAIDNRNRVLLTYYGSCEKFRHEFDHGLYLETDNAYTPRTKSYNTNQIDYFKPVFHLGAAIQWLVQYLIRI